MMPERAMLPSGHFQTVDPAFANGDSPASVALGLLRNDVTLAEALVAQ